MKIIPKFIIEKQIAKKIKNRNDYRNLLVSIPENLNNKSDYDILKKSENALKAIADKNDIGLNFRNGEGLFEGQTVLDLSHKKVYFNEKLMNCDTNGLYWPDIVLERVVSVFPKITDKSTLISNLKKLTAEYPNISFKVDRKNIIKVLGKGFSSYPAG